MIARLLSPAALVLVLALAGCASGPVGDAPMPEPSASHSPASSPSIPPTPQPEARIALDGDCEAVLSLDEVSEILGDAAQPSTLLSHPFASGDVLEAWSVLACEWGVDLGAGGMLSLNVVPEALAADRFSEGLECEYSGRGDGRDDICRLSMHTAQSWTVLTLHRVPATADMLERVAEEVRARVDADGGPVFTAPAGLAGLGCDDLADALTSLGHTATPGYPSDATSPSLLGDAMEAAGATVDCGWDGDLPVEATVQAGAGSPAPESLEGWSAVEVPAADGAWLLNDQTVWLVASRGDDRLVLHSGSHTTASDLSAVAEAMLAVVPE